MIDLHSHLTAAFEVGIPLNPPWEEGLRESRGSPEQVERLRVWKRSNKLCDIIEGCKLIICV